MTPPGSHSVDMSTRAWRCQEACLVGRVLDLPQELRL